MNLRDKIHFTLDDLTEYGPITIAAFGDSVTHGMLSFHDGVDEIDYETVYWNRLRRKIVALGGCTPVNVIDAGIGGASAEASLERMDRQVLAHAPDLVIVCFGLNDINGPLDRYQNALREIFRRCREAGAETVFLTPNMLNTYVADDTPAFYRDYAHVTAEYQNGGRMDAYMDAARQVADDEKIAVCDCYARWKELSRTEDTTMLLANRINHPTREMHELFADSLFRYLFPAR